MEGAREFAQLFETGQHGQLYIVSGRHARGRTFHIFVLPEGEEAKGNGPNNPPLNADAVEVYGVIDGNPGWTESYGWKKQGPWCADFNYLFESKRLEAKHKAEKGQAACEDEEAARIEREKKVLNAYKPLCADL